MSIKEGERFAAIDIGSNSFRMEIARFEHGQLIFVDYFKEMVRLGAELDEQSSLTRTAFDKGIACLNRFAEHIRRFNPAFVSAVATQTLREAVNREAFLREGSAALGFPIKTISGREESRLIYNGVCRYLPQMEEERLVIDIGGRSTEIIVGQGFSALASESVAIGSVNLSLAHFADGKIHAKNCKNAISNAKAILENALSVVQGANWQSEYGASGTIGALADIVRENGWGDGTLTFSLLQKMLEQLIEMGNAKKITWLGLKEERKPVIAGGLCTLIAAFSLFGIKRLIPARGALRHGLLEDLLAMNDPRFQLKAVDLRRGTVARLQAKFRCDLAQAKRVRALVEGWQESLGLNSKVLGFSADLHEIGMIVSHLNYHKHGAYLIDRSDVLGFSSNELKKMTALILGQCGGLRKMSDYWADEPLMRKLLLLRLAVILCHARKDPPYPANQLPISIVPFKNKTPGKGYQIIINGDWIFSHPQTLYLLREEMNQWKRVPISVELLAPAHLD